MPISPKSLEAIAALLKVPLATLQAAATATTDTDVAIPEGLTALTTTELTTRDQNNKNAGITEGKELGYKDIKKAAGLDDTAPSKDPLKLAEAIIAKAVVDAKLPQEEKVKQANEQVAALQQKLTEATQTIAEAQKQVKQATMDRQILSLLPKDRNSMLTDDEWVSRIRTNLDIKEGEDGKLSISKGGQVLRVAATQDLMPLSDAIAGLFTDNKEKGWIDAGGGAGGNGGRGGSDGKVDGTFTKRSEVIADFEKKGISITGEGSAQITAKLAELAKADPTFDMNG